MNKMILHIPKFRECLISPIGVSCLESIDIKGYFLLYAYIKVFEAVFDDIRNKINDIETIDINSLSE